MVQNGVEAAVLGDAVLGGPFLELGAHLGGSQRRVNGVSTMGQKWVNCSHCHHLHRLVDRIFGHLAVRGPLAARDSHQPTADHVDHVVPAQLLGVGGVGVRVPDQRPQPSP